MSTLHGGHAAPLASPAVAQHACADMSDQDDDLYLNDRVAVADASAYQGERGTVVGFFDTPAGHACGVLVRLDGHGGIVVRVGWWKDVQLIARHA